MGKPKVCEARKVTAPPRRELRVILNRFDAVPEAEARPRIIGFPDLSVVLDRSPVPSTPSSQRRRRRPVAPRYLRSKRRLTASQRSATSISRGRELVVRSDRLDIVDAVAANDAAAVPTARPTPVPAVRPAPIPAARPAPPRRRHAAIPRRVTYRKGAGTSDADLEALCAAPFNCGALNELCRVCGAKFFTREPKNRAGIRLMCCKNGSVSIPHPRSPPELKALYCERSHRSTEFLNNVRSANSLFAMASFKTSAPARQVEGQGRWCFSVCGQIYHYTVGVPTSQNLREPVLSHYYFLDVEEVLDRRNDFLGNRVSVETLEFLDTCLRRHNKYIRAFQTVREVLAEEADRRGARPVDDVIIAFSRGGDMNVRRREFNLPESRSEIAAVFYGMEPPFDVDLKLYPRIVRVGDEEGGQIEIERRHELKNLHPMSDPMVYPLLFPYGEDGFSMSLRHETHKITMREFYRYRIQCRDEFSLLHNAGKLFQQYLVDAWVRVEADTLWWIRQHQNRFRFAANEAIRRAIALHPEHANRVGRAVVLPSGFPGGPRHAQRQYLDAMAVVARHGKPDLFITFTCNPNWPEIKDNLEYLQKPENRPDLVCRVFRTKLLEFMDDAVIKQIFGVVQNYHYVIEFQKRGLPHAHIVISFIPDDKILTAEQVDEIVCATIPDMYTQPLLYDLVGRYQVHRPCGTMDPRAVCMDGGRCKKSFPKSFSDNTVLGAGRDHRPIYRRPRDGRYIRLQTCTVSNSRIVPYNPYAVAKYQTHINFEVVGSLLTLKYLYKYVTKGSDCITLCEAQGEPGGVRVEIDEVNKYLDCRYVSSMEAAWRLLEFKMHDRSHAVLVLPVHLPGQHCLVFEEDADIENLENRLAQRSKLEAWFQLNAVNVDARQYRYGEIPEHYVWENKEGAWRARKQISKLIGCVADVTPREGNMELFYMRLLLRHVRGATSFESLRTVNGVLLPNFEAACSELNLLRHTDEYDLCLREAALSRHPRQMRRLFALIVCVLTDETVGQVPLLWRTHRDRMTEDFLRRGSSRVEAIRLAIEEIEVMIRRNRADLNCARLGINDDVDENDGHVDDAEPADPSGERFVNETEEPIFRAEYRPGLLNEEQKVVFLRVLQAVCRTTGAVLPPELFEELGDDVPLDDVAACRRGDHLFFVDGPGGTGKTYLYNTLITYVGDVLKLPVLSVAWTGIAASLLIRGKTAHRGFKLPLNLTESSTVGWPLEHEETEILRGVSLILWDEAPMTHRFAVQAVDRYLREVTGVRGIPMGGKCSIFGGDFRQVLPVIPLGHRAQVIDSSLKRLPFWESFAKFRLTVNVRVAGRAANGDGPPRRAIRELGGRSFEAWLLALGEGKLPYVAFERLRSAPADLIEIPALFHSAGVEDLLSFVYPDGYLADDVGDKAILCPTNAMVDEINDSILNSLEGDFTTYYSVDECNFQEEDEVRVPLDVLHSISVAGLPPHELKLKVGAVVMLLRNLDLEGGQCNGTRMRITGLGEHVIQCEIVTGENRGRSVLLPKIKMIARDSMIPHEIIRMQFPIRVAYAMTVNKAQGQTLKRVGIYLKRSCFSHGQLYVAFSRVGSPSNVRAYVEDGLKQGSFRHLHNKKFTRNVVYQSVVDDSEGHPAQEIIRRTDVAEEQELRDSFGEDSYEEFFDYLNVTQIMDEVEDHSPASAADVVDSVGDRYAGKERFDFHGKFVPLHSRGELAARVSTPNRPGTTGIHLGRPSPPTVSSSESESSTPNRPGKTGVRLGRPSPPTVSSSESESE